jgi:hypothetical protein
MTDHCVLDYSRQPPAIHCRHCGCKEPVTLPIPVRQLVAITDNFLAQHRSCIPNA